LPITAHADVNAFDNRGYTALMAAAEKDYLVPVKMLIAAGADVSFRNRKNETELLLGQNNGHVCLVELLNEADEQQ
jgi:ankyrin repeat protein